MLVALDAEHDPANRLSYRPAARPFGRARIRRV